MSSHVFPRIGCESLPHVVGGDGIYLIDADGKRYLDGSSGAAVSCLGHSNAAVADAIASQVQQIAYAHTSFFTSAAAEELAALLTDAAPKSLNRAYFVSGGSEAVEAAIKLARQYHVANGEPTRTHIIGRKQSYHGNTLGALAVGGNLLRRSMFEPLLFANSHHIAACHYWRWGGEETPEEYGKRVAYELEEKILQLGAKNVAAFIAETVVGATMGAVVAAPGYFQHVRDICNRYGVLLILDEVMCGIGRTGVMFACESEGIAPDIICVAKGLGAGMQPLGAMLCSEQLYRTVTAAGGFQHSHTYTGHITACAAGVAVLKELQKQHLVDNARIRGTQLASALRHRFGDHAHVGDIRGRGLFLGMEFIDHDKTPFDPSLRIYAKIKQAAFEKGLLVYAMGGTIDGHQGDHLLIAPPYIITEEQITELVDRLAAALDEVF